MRVPDNQIIECRDPVEFPNFIAHAVGSQEVACQSVCPDNAQRDASGCQFAVELMQHVRSGEINIGRRREIADNEPDG